MAKVSFKPEKMLYPMPVIMAGAKKKIKKVREKALTI